jgi:catechol 2,3-dioxygenase-like lactoylglutathione lyase family enzyme
MRLNHLDLPVPDLPAATRYFTQGFGFDLLRDGADMAILRGEDGFILVLNRGEGRYPDGFHIGFLQPSDDAVHAAHARLIDAGIAAPAPEVRYGCLQFWCAAPGGVTIEVSHRG